MKNAEQVTKDTRITNPKARAKFLRMMAEGWTEIGALEVLAMHGYRASISTLWVF